MNAPSYVWTLLYFGGMLLAFIGERIVGAGTARALTGVGVLCIGAAIAVRAARAKRAGGDRSKAERMLIALYAIGAFSVALYLAQSDLSSTVLGKPLERDWPKLATSLAAIWPVIWIFSALPIIMGEFSYATVARSPRIEIARVRDAIWSGVGLAGAVVFAFALCYVGAERDKKVDLSYFRTAKPGESTRKIVQTMDQPIQVAMFFPPSNEVREEVAGYFDDLKKESKLLDVQSYDRDVQTRLLKVARPARNVYFVTGHGERTFDPV
ncbi:MAG TPA: ABC transporter, partial [Polyangia bacterium]